jgi:DNA gyrase inhibitor GyrI
MRVDFVYREPTAVVYAGSKGDPEDIPGAAARAFAALEAVIPPRGRKAYGYWHPPDLEYRACYGRQDDDDATSLGLAEGVIPGGHYCRARLKGKDVFSQIPEAFDQLSRRTDLSQDGRPWVEFYRRHDQVDVLVPISTP